MSCTKSLLPRFSSRPGVYKACSAWKMSFSRWAFSMLDWILDEKHLTISCLPSYLDRISSSKGSFRPFFAFRTKKLVNSKLTKTNVIKLCAFWKPVNVHSKARLHPWFHAFLWRILVSGIRMWWFQRMQISDILLTLFHDFPWVSNNFADLNGSCFYSSVHINESKDWSKLIFDGTPFP